VKTDERSVKKKLSRDSTILFEWTHILTTITINPCACLPVNGAYEGLKHKPKHKIRRREMRLWLELFSKSKSHQVLYWFKSLNLKNMRKLRVKKKTTTVHGTCNVLPNGLFVYVILYYIYCFSLSLFPYCLSYGMQNPLHQPCWLAFQAQLSQINLSD